MRTHQFPRTRTDGALDEIIRDAIAEALGEALGAAMPAIIERIAAEVLERVREGDGAPVAAPTPVRVPNVTMMREALGRESLGARARRQSLSDAADPFLAGGR